MSTSEPTSTGPVLDPETLSILASELQADAAPGLMESLVQTFIRDAEARSGRIADAAGAYDLQGLEHESHALGSSAATFGAMALHHLARAIEAACQGRDVDKAVGLSVGMDAAVSAAAAALSDYLKQQEPPD